MHSPYRIPPWKTAPFIRLLLPLAAGIMLQWYLQFPLHFILLSFVCFCCAFFLFHFIALSAKYKLRALQGVLLQLIICSAGLFVAWQKDVRHHRQWYGHSYNDSVYLIVRIDEPLIRKEKSSKAEGCVEAVVAGSHIIAATGKIQVYLARDIATPLPGYGDKILFKKTLQPIRNAGNPGEFNYRRYACFQQIFHHVYLKPCEYAVLKEKYKDRFRQFIYRSREYIVGVLQQYLPKDKNISGIAAALLIGYKEDLDKDLVQAYSNTGVVHIIAISGLHLGLIYCLLAGIFNWLPFFRRHSFIRVVLILGSLWLFAILTGSSASVLRSAVMFTCILFGKTYFKGSSVYNALAASAFMLLCYDPYFLWDVGFQLSYLAVIGIVWLQRPVYHLLYIQHKWAGKIWNMISVTVAAQLAAFPLCIYYFHQFPNLFLITNLIAVPLSTVILFAEIFLITFSWITVVAVYAGKLLSFLIAVMNFVITICNGLPFAVIDKIDADVPRTWLLYGIIGFVCSWLLYRHRMLFRLLMTCLLFFTVLQVLAKINRYGQQKIVIYNIPRSCAIDFICKDKYYFAGDNALKQDGAQQNFYFKPARIAMHVDESCAMLPGLSYGSGTWQFMEKRIMIIENAMLFEPRSRPVPVDILIISKNAGVYLSNIAGAIRPSVVVFAASNSLWKIANWKKECELLLLRFHSVPEQGAFIYDIK
jgi:competence protein ComEC